MAAKYDERLDRESAAEMLAQRADRAAQGAEAAEAREEAAEEAEREFQQARRYNGGRVKQPRSTSRARKTDTIGEAMAEAVIKELKGTTGRRIVRGILGGVFKGR